jgi:tetratricopeptide (TPR) repeat protein
MADSYNQIGYLGFRPLGLTIPKAQDAARYALELDPESVEAHSALGFINAMWLWDWKEAEGHYRRALELDPNDAAAHHYYALFLASANRLPEANHQMAIAQQLDPLEPSVNSGSAYVLYFQRDYEKSIAFCEDALKADSGFAIAHELLGWNNLQLKRYPEAIAELKRAQELAPGSTLYLAELGRAYFIAGNDAEARKVLDQLDELSKSSWVGGSAQAMIYAARGDRDKAIEWLNIAVKQEDGFLLWLKVSPEFDSLRDDPSFTQLVAQIGLPPGIQQQ